MQDLYDVGVYFGKFLPCHKGHVFQMIQAATKCKKLYIVISSHKDAEAAISKRDGIPIIDVRLRKQWVCQETQDMENIVVKVLDEENMPIYPNGWDMWTVKLQEVVGEHIDAFFCGEEVYAEKLPKYFPSAKVELFDPDRKSFPISATKIRKNPYKNWDYIIGPARPFFAKKVLIAGVESTGKSTLTKYLAKIFCTSWSEEVGRYYAKKYLGGDETIFTPEDFTRIAHLQVEQDYDALRDANKVCFFDTDATITNYYSKLYLGETNKTVEQYIDPTKYDVVLFMEPDIDWVDDGMRLLSDKIDRIEKSSELFLTFTKKGFNVVTIGGNYTERLDKAIEIIRDLIE